MIFVVVVVVSLKGQDTLNKQGIFLVILFKKGQVRQKQVSRKESSFSAQTDPKST